MILFSNLWFRWRMWMRTRRSVFMSEDWCRKNLL
jgi:hypothetical protein